jgi:hypothetical protein
LSFEFVFQYPVWFILICLLTGLLYAWLLYRKDKSFIESRKWLARLLFGLRFSVVSLLVFLLFSPLLRFVTRTVEKPVIVILQDNSASLVNDKNQGYFKKDWPEQLQKLEESLSENYEVKKYSFSDRILDSFNLDYKGKETDISAVYKEVNNLYLNRNVGAVIVATDGIYNKGVSPLYVRNELKAPVYTIALGDTTLKRDLMVQQVNHNQLAYLNNTFPVEVNIDARKLQGKSSVLRIEKNGKLLESRPINITGNSFLKKEEFRFKADESGIQKYRVTLSPVDGEFTQANNVRDFFIEVLDSRQKVLILADAPHPDVAAIRFSLQQNENYEVDVQMGENFNSSTKPYSLVVMHQLPSRNNPATKVLNEVQTNGTPVWFIAGQNSGIQALNQAQGILQFNNSRGGFNDAQPRLNKDFSLFTLSEELMAASVNLEPLQVMNAGIKLQPQATVLFNQRIGSVDTQFPLLAFSSSVDKKQAVLAGEGIWRWRLQSFAEKQDHSLFDNFLSRIVQFLSVRTERRNLRIVTANSFAENESVTFEAEVYNAAYELVNTPDVSLTILDENGKKFPYTFTRTASAYRLDAGLLNAGEYKYEALTNVSGKQYQASGRFVVRPVVAELINTTADHNLLKTWAERNQGKMGLPTQVSTLPELIGKREDVKPVSHSETRLEELIRIEWIFAFLLALLSAEWFLRRRNGTY